MREVKKAEKAALKRDQMKERRESPTEEVPTGDRVATADDMAGYGFPADEEDVEEELD